jgi:hypothetical protein
MTARRRYVTEREATTGNYVARETASDTVMRIDHRREVIRELVSALNGGVAFNGWTPRFFINGVTTRK